MIRMPGRRYDFRASRRWTALKKRILQRDAYRCRYCGAEAGEVDHVRAVARGGAMWDPANLVASCRTCNRSKGTRAKPASRPEPAAPRYGSGPSWTPIVGDFSKRDGGGDVGA